MWASSGSPAGARELAEPWSGALLVDGRELEPAERAAYCARIGYVPQNPYILAGSIAENVAFSQWGKPWDEARVLRASLKPRALWTAAWKPGS